MYLLGKVLNVKNCIETDQIVFGESHNSNEITEDVAKKKKKKITNATQEL